MLTTEQYAARAAEKFLAAWERQNGECYSVSCGITYSANMLGKAVNALGLTLPGDARTWWAHRYLMLARQISTRETV